MGWAIIIFFVFAGILAGIVISERPKKIGKGPGSGCVKKFTPVYPPNYGDDQIDSSGATASQRGNLARCGWSFDYGHGQWKYVGSGGGILHQMQNQGAGVKLKDDSGLPICADDLMDDYGFRFNRKTFLTWHQSPCVIKKWSDQGDVNEFLGDEKKRFEARGNIPDPNTDPFKVNVKKFTESWAPNFFEEQVKKQFDEVTKKAAEELDKRWCGRYGDFEVTKARQTGFSYPVPVSGLLDPQRFINRLQSDIQSRQDQSKDLWA